MDTVHKVLVLGSRGMLGKYMTEVLSKENIVHAATRNNFDISDYESYAKFFEYMKSIDIVINCAGTIKPAVDKQTTEKTFMCNTVFPLYLAHCAKLLDKKVVHITTDCVYSGTTGDYTESDPSDVHDVYGLSKSLGESEYTCNIRTSIIGEEDNNKYSLLEWAKGQSGKIVHGYTNHMWSGVTCLELSFVVASMIHHNYYWNGVRHVESEQVSKYELLKMISDEFKLNLNIIPSEAKEACNRTLKSNFQELKVIKPLQYQIKELANYRDDK